jgi:phosphoenolpyruvate carboxykinase (ATP)
MGSHPFAVYLVNTGRVGGPEGHPDSKKLEIEDSGAIVKGIAEETIAWERDPDFGYEVASVVPGIEDVELLQPRRLYARSGRSDEYERLVATLKRERAEFLASYPGLRSQILAAVS